ncbi:hypothetical protein [Denitromonas iodatirespirans]|uniref:Uncharacterized protein n=1 Tax=Denitromonas iodatirespirans TaxID=2795389 RepID=A0A944DHK2_DENI1|nr:hypothetical protein [Denitromonas iodatirespirans]MBT0963003.1 hypothetical protein [Denitromonas iodatirespirans]MCZ4307050.1 hypothetical protein [Zoogloeaceae bacterium G21618-S1]TVT73189.1 MAG: hypothetical protein FHP92_14915 [Denitromonas halophila]
MLTDNKQQLRTFGDWADTRPMISEAQLKGALRADDVREIKIVEFTPQIYRLHVALESTTTMKTLQSARQADRTFKNLNLLARYVKGIGATQTPIRLELNNEDSKS